MATWEKQNSMLFIDTSETRRAGLGAAAQVHRL